MRSAFDNAIRDAANQVLNQLKSDNPSGYETRQDWLKAINAYKAEHGTTRGFPAGTSYTDADGQVWNYAAGARGKPGGMRRKEATERFTNKRKVNVANSKLTLEDYTKEWGPQLGEQLFNEASNKLKIIKKGKYPGMDIDHIDSAADGGLEHPNNFRLQNKTDNRAEQNRSITAEQRNALMIARDKGDQVKLQGPRPTPRVRQQILSGSRKGGTRTTSSSSVVDKLLNDRESNYQGALQIGRNDLLFRERVLNELKTTYGASQELLQDFDQMISQTRRARRDITSEGSNLFEDDLLNYSKGIKSQENLSALVNITEAGERQRSQPIPGTEAHHPASVSSTESLVQNMDEAEIRKLWNIAKKNGYTVGSEAEGFIPLSKPAHTTGGKNWGSDYAHVGADGKTPDPGRFKTTALPKGTTAKDAWASLKPILDEQRALNTKAYNHPTETMMRGLVEKDLGKPVEWQGPVTSNRAILKAEAKARGINATTISKELDRNPGLKDTGLIPGVNVATASKPRLPPGMKRPDKPPTIPVSKPKPTPKPTPKPPVGQKAKLNGNPVVWDGKSWKPVTPNRIRLGSNRRPVNRRGGGTTRPPAAGTTRTRSQSTQFSWDNPLSPLNRSTGMYGGIERRANEAMQDIPGWSPHWLRFAD
jgi:hypothetical protein